MNKTNRNLYRVIVATLVAICVAPDAQSAVVQRGVAARGTDVRSANARANRTPTLTTTTNVTAKAETLTTETPTVATAQITQTEIKSESVTPILNIENKSSKFENVLLDFDGNTSDLGDAALAEMIRQQRAALDAADEIDAANATMKNATIANKNACDTSLRTCMSQKCGGDFTKCSGDTDMTWGDKMDSCRRDTTCTGDEYKLFSAEIKSDRDMNARLLNYNATIDCGNRYNECIIGECGETYAKCLGKSAGDMAINKCKSIATECRERDSGLAVRMGDVFATLRVDAEEHVARDEARLYELRDRMRETCQMLGAMFDERTFNCVYTVNFFANNSTTPYASKKAYAGSSFTCTPDWFGIDVTTFKENAYRLTREQSSASSALLGSGLGIAAGAITSGAIDRAIETKKAKNELKDAQEAAGIDPKAEKKEKKEAKKNNKTKKNQPESDSTGGGLDIAEKDPTIAAIEEYDNVLHEDELSIDDIDTSLTTQNIDWNAVGTQVEKDNFTQYGDAKLKPVQNITSQATTSQKRSVMMQRPTTESDATKKAKEKLQQTQKKQDGQAKKTTEKLQQAQDKQNTTQESAKKPTTIPSNLLNITGQSQTSYRTLPDIEI